MSKTKARRQVRPSRRVRIHKTRFSRVITALVTPFNEDGTINFALLVVLALRASRFGMVLITGTTAESPTLLRDVEMEIYRVVAAAIGADRMICGIGTNDTADTIEFALRVEAEIGPAAFLVATGYYNLPSSKGIYRHFKAVADAVHTPIIMYNIPARGCTIPPIVQICLAKECPNIVAVKEASGNHDQILYVARRSPKGFEVLLGNDGDVSWALWEQRLGVPGSNKITGVISVISNMDRVGPDMQGMFDAHETDDFREFERCGRRLQLLHDVAFVRRNPEPIKYMMKLTGDNVGGCRQPLLSLEQEDMDMGPGMRSSNFCGRVRRAVERYLALLEKDSLAA